MQLGPKYSPPEAEMDPRSGTTGVTPAFSTSFIFSISSKRTPE